MSILLGNCKTNRTINFKHHSITAKSELQYLDYQANCENIASDYPVISQMEKDSEVQMILLGIAMQSEYADFIQRGMALKHMDDEQKLDFINDSIKLLIKSKNATIN